MTRLWCLGFTLLFVPACSGTIGEPAGYPGANVGDGGTPQPGAGNGNPFLPGTGTTPDPTIEHGANCGNGVDDNQNGVIDEGCSCVPGDTQPCYPPGALMTPVGECKTGTQTCVVTPSQEFSNHWGDCVGAVVPTAELCDTKDNDCNGQADDGLAGTPGQPCGAHGCGVWQCNASNAIVCIQPPEGVPGQACGAHGCGVWQCSTLGHVACVGDHPRNACNQCQTVPEMCNGTNGQPGPDDNCDGWRDEGCAVSSGPLSPSECVFNNCPAGSYPSAVSFSANDGGDSRECIVYNPAQGIYVQEGRICSPANTYYQNGRITCVQGTPPPGHFPQVSITWTGSRDDKPECLLKRRSASECPTGEDYDPFDNWPGAPNQCPWEGP